MSNAYFPSRLAEINAPIQTAPLSDQLDCFGCRGPLGMHRDNLSGAQQLYRHRVRAYFASPKQFHGTSHLNAASQSECQCRPDRHLFRGRHRNPSAELPVAEERREHQRRYLVELHHARDHYCRQWRDLLGRYQQFGWKRNQQLRHTYCEFQTHRSRDLDTASQSECHCRPDRHLFCDGDWHVATELPVAEEWRQH